MMTGPARLVLLYVEVKTRASNAPVGPVRVVKKDDQIGEIEIETKDVEQIEFIVLGEIDFPIEKCR